MNRQKLLYVYYFSIGLYTAVLFGLGFAVFNIGVGAEKLPIIYVVFPFLDALTAVFMARIITRRGLKHFYKSFVIAVAGVHIFLLPIFFTYAPSPYLYGLMLVLLIAISENLLFTRTYLVQEVFSLDELRRWVPVATSFAALGALLGGGILRVSENLVTPGLIFLFAFPVVLVIGYTSHLLLRTVVDSSREIFTKRMVTVKSIWSYTTSQAFLPLLIGCVALISISDTVNEYLFHYHSTRILQNLESLTGFLGVFLTLRYLTELVLNIFLYNKLVKRVGSINLMPLLLILSALSLFIMTRASSGLGWALFARVLSVVAVIGFLLYLLEVFYQLLDPLYRPSLVTLVGYIDAFSGYAIGGGLLMIHTVGGLPSIYLISGIALVLIMFSALWIVNKRGFIDVLNASQSAEVSGVVTDIIGSIGSRDMLETLMKQAEQGSRSERLFLLYAIKNRSESEQVAWLTRLFDISEMEIRVNILEHVFVNNLFDFEPRLYEHELTDAFKNWLITRCFVNYSKLKDKSLYLSLREVLIDTAPMDDAVENMMLYMFKGEKGRYIKVLEGIQKRKRLEDAALVDKIIASYRQVEDDVHIEWFGKGNLSAPEIMVYYDEELKHMALKQFLTSTSYSTLQEVVKAYPVNEIENQLKDKEKTIIDLVCLAESKRQAYHAYDHFRELLQALDYIVDVEKSVDLEHETGDVLKSEIAQVRVSIEATLIDQALDRSHISLAGNGYAYLSNPKKRPILIEMIRGIKRDDWTDCLIALLEGDNHNCGIEKKKFDIGDKNKWIARLISYNRGEKMDENRKKEIDFMIALKSIPMFETLDIDTLKKLTEIVSVSHLNSGDTIVRKGQRGKQFFVLLRGRAAVYLNEKEGPIAVIPEGQMIGELGVINKDTRTATVKADGPVEVLAMEGDAFLELVKKNTAIGLAVIETLSSRLTSMLKDRERSG